MLGKIAILLVLISFFFTSNTISGQVDNTKKSINPQDTIPMSLAEKRYLESYNRNIKKSRINGTYIPVDLEDAFKEITALSPAKSLEKFATAEPEFVVKRLHFGLGRWLIVNWNFYEGSRFSHYLKKFGLSHPDDMARFVLLTYHNHLNNLELQTTEIASKILDERKNNLTK